MGNELPAVGAPGEQVGAQGKTEAASQPATPLTPDQERYVRELFRRESQGLVATEANKAFGGLQRWRKGIEEKTQHFDATVDALRKQGLIKDDADVEKARQTVVQEAMAAVPSFDEEGSSVQVENEQPAGQEAPNPVFVAASLLAEALGLEPDDPELKEVVNDKGIVDYFGSLMQSGSKAKARKAGETPSSEEELSQLVPGDLGTGLSGKVNPIADIKDPAQLLEMGLYGKSKG